MFKRIAATLVAAAVGGITLMAASPAMADHEPDKPWKPPVRIVSVDVTPNPVVIKGRHSVPVTATVKTLNAKHVSIDFVAVDRYHGDDWSGSGTAYDGAHDKWHGEDQWASWDRTVSLSKDDPDGKWVVVVKAVGHDEKWVTERAFFNVKHIKWDPPKGPRWSRIVDFDASPEPVKKFRKLALTGKLQGAQCYDDWYFVGQTVVLSADHCDGHDRWHGWKNPGWKDIHVFFQKKGTFGWKYVDTIETNPDGSFFTKVKAYASGTWKVVYKGGHGLHGSAATDYVKVIG